jgi:hypothetical protein
VKIVYIDGRRRVCGGGRQEEEKQCTRCHEGGALRKVFATDALSRSQEGAIAERFAAQVLVLCNAKFDVSRRNVK